MWVRFLREWWRWLVAGAGLALLSFLLVSWMLFQRVPDWYRPAEIAPEWVQSVRNDLARVQDELGERMVRSNGPFEYRISQEQINAWIAAREEMWPLSREWLPPELTDPFITIDPQGLRLAVTYGNRSVQTVLSARIEIAADEEAIHLRVAEVHTGSLPVPTSWLRSQLSSSQARAAISRSLGPVTAHKLNLERLFEGIALPNEGVWWEPRRPYRIIGLTLESGMLTLTVHPLPYRVSNR